MIPGIPKTIGGTEYIVPPVSLGTLEVYGDAIHEFEKGTLGLAGFKVVTDVVFAALKRNYPDITREFIKDNIGLEDAGDYFTAVMDVSGMKRKALEAGKATAGQ